ncbi:hypothetical protein [Candidatus Chlorohelix sp.]|uniref:hypothetical protein n=1 Tax=Candidatus Chlorohelix sp. TaxID=3139201 RepID=UPI00306A0EAE
MRQLSYFLIGLLLALVLTACGATASPPTFTGGELTISAPDSVDAGIPISLTVKASQAPDGAVVTLIAYGSAGPRIYRGTFNKNEAFFTLPESDTKQSGLVTLVAKAGQVQIEKRLTLKPGAPIEPLQPLVGAKAVVADTQHWSMVVIIPFDRFGNPVAEGTPIKMKAKRPDDRLEEQVFKVTNLLSWWRIYSGVKAGHTIISGTTNGVFGPESILHEVPGLPVPFSINVDPLNLTADGTQLATISTSTLRDQFDNKVEDGTLVTFTVDLPDGEQRVLPAYTIDGIAGIPLQAPRQPGQIKIKGTVLSIESSVLTFTLQPGPAVGVFPVSATKADSGKAVIIEAGPLLGAQQQFVPDGTPVIFTVSDKSGQKQTFNAISDQGRAKVEVRIAGMQQGNYLVEVKVGSGQGFTSFSL